MLASHYVFSSQRSIPFPTICAAAGRVPSNINGLDITATLFDIMRLFHPLHTCRARFRGMVNGVHICHIGKPVDGPLMASIPVKPSKATENQPSQRELE